MNRTGSALGLDGIFSPRRFALLLALLTAAGFLPVLFGFRSFVFRDFGLFGYPLAYHFRESFWQGEIPLWNPLNNCGLPFMAQWNTMVFYPPSLIYLLLPLPWSLNLFCLLHLYFGGLGMYLLARRWTGSSFAGAFAGIVFSCNGLALHCLMWPNNMAALGWMPWILLLSERAWTQGGRALLPAMLAGACQFMAGAPEALLLTWVVVAAVWLAAIDANRREFVKCLLRFAALATSIVVLSAVQLLPLLELIKQSQRTAGYDSGGWAMPAWGWANLLVPLFRTASSGPGVPFQIGQAWTSSYYLGVVTLWLAMVAVARVRHVRVWVLAALVLIGLVLALGDAGFIWPLLKHYLGVLGFIRYPVKMVFMVVMPLTLLGAFGVAELERRARPVGEGQEPPRTRVLGGMAGVILVAIALVLWFAWRHPLDGQNTSGALAGGTIRAFLFAVLAVGILCFRKISARRVGTAAVAWLLVVAADFLTHVPWQNPTVDISCLTPNVEALQLLREGAAPGRARAMLSLAAIQHFHQGPSTNLAETYLAHRLGQSHNLNLLEGIAKSDGFFSLYLANQQDVQYRIFPESNSVHQAVADVMAVGFMTTPGKLFAWTARTNALPMISAGQAPIFLEESNILDTILSSNFNPHVAVLLPERARSMIPATPQRDAKVTVEKFRPHDIELNVTTPAATVVSVAQAFYAPWKAYVDGTPVMLWRANHGFQAVPVPAGEHRVRLRYEDKMFRIGAIVSGVWLALLLLGRVWLRTGE